MNIFFIVYLNQLSEINQILNYSNITGFTKVCNYPNAIGGPKAITVSSTSICPIKYN
ncbi:hypothetical protein N9T13_02060 [Candidatus Pelagibacter sp.]|nr:hypothetical protein [Candidatus Pelagibacter sp.]